MTQEPVSEINELVRQHGHAKTAQILADRRKQAEDAQAEANKPPAPPIPGDAFEGSNEEFLRMVEEGKRKLANKKGQP